MILEAADLALNVGPWKTELESVIQWAKDTVEKPSAAEHVKARIRAATCAQNTSQNWKPNAQSELSVGEQASLDGAVSSQQTLDPETNRAERVKSSVSSSMHIPVNPSVLSKDDAQASNSQEDDTCPSESTRPAQSISEGEDPNTNNYGHSTFTYGGGIQVPEPIVSRPQLATTMPTQPMPTQPMPSAAPPTSPHSPSKSAFADRIPDPEPAFPHGPRIAGNLWFGGAVPVGTARTPGKPGHSVQQAWSAPNHPPQGYYDPYMYWQHQQHPHQPHPHQHHIHTPSMQPALRTQPAERKAKEASRRIREEEERVAREDEEAAERMMKEWEESWAREEEERKANEEQERRNREEEQRRILGTEEKLGKKQEEKVRRVRRRGLARGARQG